MVSSPYGRDATARSNLSIFLPIYPSECVAAPTGAGRAEARQSISAHNKICSHARYASAQHSPPAPTNREGNAHEAKHVGHTHVGFPYPTIINDDHREQRHDRERETSARKQNRRSRWGRTRRRPCKIVGEKACPKRKKRGDPPQGRSDLWVKKGQNRHLTTQAIAAAVPKRWAQDVGARSARLWNCDCCPRSGYGTKNTKPIQTARNGSVVLLYLKRLPKTDWFS
jgi:hypothetical protein